jgi:ABC-2 type transport system permease protein
MTYLRLLGTYLRLGILNELEYRVNFWVQILQTGLELLVALGGLAVVFSHTETLGGWRPAELLALVGVYFIIGGLIDTIIRPSMQRFMEDVRKGTLDFTLTKPEDAQVLVSIQRIEIWRMIDVVVGIVVLVIALLRLESSIDPGQALLFGIMLLAGGVIVYSFWLILAVCAFWFVRVENILVIFESMYQAGRWPVTIYPGWLRWILTFLVPVAFATTVPASALTGRIDASLIIGSITLAVFMLLASRWFWRFGIRFYSGASA